jgi:cell division transport system permease protein
MVLIMLGLFGLLILAGKHMETYLKENMIINVFLNNDATNEQMEVVKRNIEGQRFLKELTYVSKEQAATEFGNELGQDFVGFLGFCVVIIGAFQLILMIIN